MKRTWIIGVLLSLAILSQGCETMIKELDKGFHKNDTLLEAAKKGDTKTMKAFLRRGANVNAKDSYFGRNALHWAVDRRSYKIAKLIAENGGDPTPDSK